MDHSLSLKDRLQGANLILTKCGFVNKTHLTLSQEKQKPNILDKLEPMKLHIMLEFINDVFDQQISPQVKASDFKGNIQFFKEQGSVQQECITLFSLLIVVSYSKLIMQSNIFSQVDGFNSLVTQDYVVQNLKLTSFLLAALLSDQKFKPAKDVIDLANYFTELGSGSLVSTLDKTDDLDITNQNQIRFVETLIFSILSQCLCFIKSFEQENHVSPRIIKSFEYMFNLFEKMNSVYFCRQYDLTDPDFKFGFIFKDLIQNVIEGTYYQKASLINIALVVCEMLVIRINQIKVKQSYGPGMLDIIENFDNKLMSQLDKLFLTQIRYYQLTEHYRIKQQDITSQQVINEVKNDDQALDNKQTSQKQIIEYEYMDQSEHLSLKIVRDPEWAQPKLKQMSIALPQSKFYLSVKEEQQNWLCVNLALYKLSIQIMPRYYMKKENSSKLGQSDSLLSHLCDLLRVQLCFILKFNLQQPYLLSFVKRLSVIPVHIGYNCQLVQTLHQKFDLMFVQSQNPDFNQAVLRQIYTTLEMICAGQFDWADQLQYFKTQYLLFMNVKLEAFSVPQVLSSESTLKQIVDQLFKLFKVDFYAEKYVKIFEEMFDLDSVADVLHLQEIVRQLEQKRQDQSNHNDAVLLVNKVLIQQISINLIVQSANKSEPFFKLVLQKIIDEIDRNGLYQCDPQGTVYVERSQIYINADTLQRIATFEYVISQSGAFTSHLYQCLKLCLGLISRSLLIDCPNGKIYDILNVSDQHFDKQHSKNDKQCDDCLTQQFHNIEINQALHAASLTQLFSLLLQRCKLLSYNLEQQEQNQQLNYSESKIKQMQSMSLDDIKKYTSKRGLLDRAQIGFKIVQKVCSMMLRFLIFCSQNALLAASLIASITGKVPQLVNQQYNQQQDRLSLIQKLETIQITQTKDIVNPEFRLLFLRNILFQIDPYDDQAIQIIEMLQYTLRQIQSNYKAFRKQETEFNKLMIKLCPGFKQKNLDQSKTRDRSFSISYLSDYEAFIIKQKQVFRKYAQIQVSIITLYTSVVRKGEPSIDLFSRKTFLEKVINYIKIFVEQEQSYIYEMIQGAMQVFQFQFHEETNPLKLQKDVRIQIDMLNDQKYANAKKIIYERHLEHILSTLIVYINIVCPEDTDVLSPQAINQDLLYNLMQSIRLVFEMLNKQIRGLADSKIELTTDLLKLHISLRQEQIKQLKKIMIFLKEWNGKVPGIDILQIIKQFSILLISLFGLVPKASQMRDFFSFFREILYYNNDLDEVDASLLEEVLGILNQSINLKQKSILIDHFQFSAITPGVLLMNNFECNKEVQICMMFKFNKDILQCKDSRTKHKMVIMSIKDKSDETTAILQATDIRLSLDVEIILDIEANRFWLKDFQKINDKNNVPVQKAPNYIKLTNKWHMLIVRIKRQRQLLDVGHNVQIDAYIDKLSSENRVSYPMYKSDSKAKFYLALGNTVDFCFEKKAANDHHFKGMCSLPLFLQGLPEYKALTHEYQENQTALILKLKEFIKTKQIINISKVDIFLTTQNLVADEGKQKKKLVVELHSLDLFTQTAINVHQILNKHGYLCAVHSRRTSEVFVCIGGFKNVYPLISKIVKSNIQELGKGLPGHILSQVFKLLNTIINLEPDHIETLLQKRNLIQVIKYCILKIGTHKMITSEFITEVKNIIRNNKIVQVSVQSNLQQITSYSVEIPQTQKQFYTELLKDFMHQILLDSTILSLPCQTTSRQDYQSNFSLQSDLQTCLVFNEVVELIYQVCCPSKLQDWYIIRPDQNKESKVQGQQIGMTSKTLYQTNYNELRAIIVTSETVQMLINLVNISPFNNIQNLSLLNQIGESITSCILHLDDKESFAQLVKLSFLESKSLEKVQLLIYLKVILRVIMDDRYKDKRGLQSVQSNQRIFNETQLALVLCQFKDESGSGLLDEIISVTLMLTMQIYLNRRSKFRQVQFQEKVALSDPEKSKLLKQITEPLSKNMHLLTGAYLTLMYITFKKRSDTGITPTVEQVLCEIKNSQIRHDKTISTEVIDFDIDFFFLVLDNLNKYSSETKVLFLSHYSLFLKNHQERFMKVFTSQNNIQSQTNIQNLNPYNERFNEFYFKIVLLAINSQEEELVTISLDLIVNLCVYQITKSHDDFNEPQLSEPDEWGFQMFRRVFAFFDTQIESQRLLQLQVLQRVIFCIVLEINTRKSYLSCQEQIKLNLKLILMLQFIEEMYTKYSKELCQTPLFYQTLMLLMFMFEQLGILTLDVPDRVSIDIDTNDVSKKTSMQAKRIKNASKGGQQKLGQIETTDLLLNVDEPFQKNFKQTISQSSNISDTLFQDVRLVEKAKPTDNFVSGGPARIFLHIILNLLAQDNTALLFEQSTEMLRYLVLRQRGSYFQTTISTFFAHNFSTQTVDTYTLFSRPNYIKDLKESRRQQKRRQAVKLKDKSSSVQSKKTELDTPVHEFIRAEMKIFKMTIEGVYQSINRKLQLEKVFDSSSRSRQQLERFNGDLFSPELPSERDLSIAEKGLQYIDSKIGFTATTGFIIIQLIAEAIEIMACILESKSEFKEDSQATKERDMTYVTQILKQELDDLNQDQIKKALLNSTKQRKILVILRFLFDCMNAELFSNKTVSPDDDSSYTAVKNYKVYNKIIDQLDYIYNSKEDSSVTRKNVRFFSTYLNGPVDELIETNLKESVQKGFSIGDVNIQVNFGLGSEERQKHAINQLQAFGYADVSKLTPKPTIKRGKTRIELYPEVMAQVVLKKAESSTQLLTFKLENLIEDSELNFKEVERVEDAQHSSELSALSEGSKSEDSLQDRQSWVQSIQDKSLTKSGISNKTKLTADASDFQINQYSQQVLTFIKKLFNALSKLVLDSADETVRQNQLAKIIKQTLFKEKQRQISIAFGQATSHNFQIELFQVKLNSDKTYSELKADKDKFTNKQIQNDSNSKLQSDSLFKIANPMLQSQQIYPKQPNDKMLLSQQFPPEFRRAQMKKQKSANSEFVEIKQGIDRPELYEDYLSQIEKGIKSSKLSLDYQFTKYSFKKTVKRLSEDESSLWYDNVEELISDFQEIKEIYDAIQRTREDEDDYETADKRKNRMQLKFSKLNLKEQPSTVVKDVDRILEYATIIQNPNQKHFFVSQRRNIDAWGRMMLLKPNRKALDYKAWLYYDYCVIDFLNKMFMMALINDDDCPDLFRPPPLKDYSKQEEFVALLHTKSESARKLLTIQEESGNQEDDLDQELLSDIENDGRSDSGLDFCDLQALKKQADENPTAYSLYWQEKRTEILHKISKHRLLQRILTCSKSGNQSNLKDSDVARQREEKIESIKASEKHNYVRCFEAQNIRLLGTYWGTILITKDYFYFLSACTPTPDRQDLVFVDLKQNSVDKKELIFQWDNIDEIMKRKVVNIFQGVDITTFDKKVYTFNLCSELKADEFIQQAYLFLKDKKDEANFRIIEKPTQVFFTKENSEAQFLNEWKQEQRSNMEFLMLLNKYSGRSFNDTTQYPIFPWVLKDYNSEAQEFWENFKTEQCFRDFTRLTGNLSDSKMKSALEEFNDTAEEIEMNTPMYGKGAFHFRFGCSSQLNTAAWLCRLEPYTSLNYISSDCKRDGRVNIDFQLTYDTIMQNKQATSELLPELYYLPEILMNVNKISLGYQINHKTNQKYQLDAMLLPPWAMNYYDFIRVMREALESKFVTANIGYWIDQVFGAHQKSKEHTNVYYAGAYEEYWTRDRLKATEDDKKKLKDDEYISLQLKEQIMNFFIHPSKLLDKSLVSQIDKDLKFEEKKVADEQKNFNQIIKAFVENQSKDKKKKLKLGQLAVHNTLDASTNIVHMLFNNEKKCLVFVRVDDSHDRRPDTGNIVVYLCQETLSKESFKEKSFDLSLRYEWVADELNNVFQVYSYQANRLFVCGYLDNSLRIFDLEAKPGQHLIKLMTGQHCARITCIKFSADFKYLITCDADGVILHYGSTKNKTQQDRKQDAFPYKQLHKLQDQMDEILAIDSNQTLDMYVTLSRDGTIALRCQRTSKLWYQFTIYSKKNKQSNENVFGFTKNFRHVLALKLSLHGYIVLVCQQEQTKCPVYLVYNLSGDVLLRYYTETSEIKGIFLNATEDQLIVAQNFQFQGVNQGNIRVMKLYGLEKIANLSELVYKEALVQIQQQKNSQNNNGQSTSSLKNNQSILTLTPTIQVIAMKKGEASLNICFENKDQQPSKKEIICFETSKIPVWTQLQDMALAPRANQL